MLSPFSGRFNTSDSSGVSTRTQSRQQQSLESCGAVCQGRELDAHETDKDDRTGKSEPPVQQVTSGCAGKAQQ